jgi:hypothetical protein
VLFGMLVKLSQVGKRTRINSQRVCPEDQRPVNAHVQVSGIRVPRDAAGRSDERSGVEFKESRHGEVGKVDLSPATYHFLYRCRGNLAGWNGIPLGCLEPDIQIIGCERCSRRAAERPAKTLDPVQQTADHGKARTDHVFKEKSPPLLIDLRHDRRHLELGVHRPTDAVEFTALLKKADKSSEIQHGRFSCGRRFGVPF